MRLVVRNLLLWTVIRLTGCDLAEILKKRTVVGIENMRILGG
jgi:hypothetical protein